MKRLARSLLICVLALSVLQLAASAEAQNTTLHALTVRRFVNTGGGGGSSVTFSNAQADAAFTLATTVTRTDDDGAGDGTGNGGGTDQPCDHAMGRTGNVGTFSSATSNGIVSNSSEWNEINGKAGFVKVVTGINWCGGPLPGAIGCANQGGLSGIVVQQAASVGGTRGALWDHEFGHSTGLSHRTGPTLIMNASISGTNNMLNWTECGSMQSDNVDQDGPGGNPAPSQPAGAGPSPGEEPRTLAGVSIEALVQQGYVDSLPVEAADYFGESDLRRLRAMLRDPGQAERHAQIAALIGVISRGADQDAQALIEFANGAAPEHAASSAVVSLGMVANRGSSRAHDFLIQASNDPSRERAEWAVGGLSMAGTDRARQQLQRLQVEAARPVAGAQFGRSGDELAEALDTHLRIASQGLRGYFGR